MACGSRDNPTAVACPEEEEGEEDDDEEEDYTMTVVGEKLSSSAEVDITKPRAIIAVPNLAVSKGKKKKKGQAGQGRVGKKGG